MVDDQHDGPREVRVFHLWDGDQQSTSKRSSGHLAIISGSPHLRRQGHEMLRLSILIALPRRTL
jgi:hypothetical protein